MSAFPRPIEGGTELHRCSPDLPIPLPQYLDLSNTLPTATDACMRHLLTMLGLSAILTSCATTGGLPEGAFIGYYQDGLEITGLTGDITGAGYNLKAKTAYVIYATGQRETWKITGAGFGAGQLALYLQGGGRVTVNTKTGQVTTSIVGGTK